MNKKSRKMSKQDVSAMLTDLDRWAAGQFGPKLTWEMLEDRFGFSRQALQAKPEIKAAYDFAKKSINSPNVGRKDKADRSLEELLAENAKLMLEITNYRHKELLWKERWQRIAFHIRQRGIQVHQVDFPLPKGIVHPSEKEAAIILKDFDIEIPNAGRI